MAEPDLDLRRVRPEERGHARGEPRGRDDGQSLEQLHVGRALIKLARRAVAAMHTLALTKCLFGHHAGRLSATSIYSTVAGSDRRALTQSWRDGLTGPARSRARPAGNGPALLVRRRDRPAGTRCPFGWRRCLLA